MTTILAEEGIDSLLEELYIHNGFPYIIHEVNDLVSDLRFFVKRKRLIIDKTKIRDGLLNILEQYNQESRINPGLYKELEESILKKYSQKDL